MANDQLSAEPGFEPRTLWLEGRDLTTAPTTPPYLYALLEKNRCMLPTSLTCTFYLLETTSLYTATSDQFKGNSCYTFHTSGTSWTANRETCKNSGGDLISIETQGEWSYISSGLRLYSNKNSTGWHVGLEQNNGQWIWINGKPFEIGHWGAHEPSGDGPYAIMDTKGKLFDVSDSDNNGFVCEKPLGKIKLS